MDYVNFGHTGLKVSRLAYGLGFRGQSDAAEAERAIERAVELGINFIDCANVYGLEDHRRTAGTSEQILARALKRHRDDLVISSKVFSRVGDGPNDAGLSRYHIMREIDRTLSRLDTDHIDVYILHSWDESTPLEETLRAIDDLVRAAHEVEIVTVEEFGDDVGAEGEGHAAVVLTPALLVGLRVRPQHVAQQALIRHLCRSARARQASLSRGLGNGPET